MTDEDTALWNAIWLEVHEDMDPEDTFSRKRPLLAHYTSLSVVEQILKNNELWFSNPLFMNDLEEVRFGFVNGISAFKNDDDIRQALQTERRYELFSQSLDGYVNEFAQKHLLDTYVFCLSEHDPENHDGKLSMWRGYGGNGGGAALVFDTSKLDPIEDSPLKLGRVRYESHDGRMAWFRYKAAKLAKLIRTNEIPDDRIYHLSYAVFLRIRLFALFTKHDGFKEEEEWRVVYSSAWDEREALKPMHGYVNGPRGVEPKLKLKIESIDSVLQSEISIENILNSVLLGPSISHDLALDSVERMLELIGKTDLKERLVASSIPFRAM